MSSETSSANAQRSPTWFQKGLATITRMGRVSVPSRSSESPNPLRELFTDLIAYIIFFEASCGEQPPPLDEFREKVLALVNPQEERAKAMGVPAETFREARFAVLSWVDEIILNSTWPHRAHWQHLMLTYYGTLNAGEEFFRRLELLPSQANEVREIYYLCLSLGFQGRYAFGDEHRELKDLKQRLYKQLCGSKGDIRQSYPRLFPEAYQRANVTPKAKSGFERLWYIVPAFVPVLLFICLWFLLWQKSDSILAMLEKPPSLPPQQTIWSTSLVEELRKKGLRAVDEPEGVRITLESLLFAVNSSQLNPQAMDKINDIIATVKRYAPERVIVVEGHASKEREVDEARNQKLSDDRARTVADAFVRSGFRSDRISSRGFGSSKPVALNDTEEGRMQNRRVEIFVKK
jgi:type VI secretion system protein ImpK